MATVSGQGHHFGQITAQGNSNLTLGNVCIQNILQSGDAVSSDEAKQKGKPCAYRRADAKCC